MKGQVIVSHPLAKDCLAFYVATDAQGNPQECMGIAHRFSPVRRSTWGMFENQWNFIGGGPNEQTSRDMRFSSGAFTVWVKLRQLVAPSAGTFVGALGKDSFVSSSDNQGWTFQMFPSDHSVYPSKMVFIHRNNTVDTNAQLASTTNAAVGDRTYGHSSDGSATRRIYVNGLQEATVGTVLNPTANNTTAVNVVGSSGNFQIYAWGVWKRELTAAEQLTLHNRPYEMILWKRPPIYYPFIQSFKGSFLNINQAINRASTY